MRIIEKKQWEAEVNCTSCKSRLAIEEVDVLWGDFGAGYGGDTDWKFYFKCAVCGSCVVLPSGFLPSHVRASAQGQSRRSDSGGYRD